MNPSYLVCVDDKRSRPEAFDRLANVLFEIGKRIHRERRTNPGFSLNGFLEFRVGKGEHAARTHALKSPCKYAVYCIFMD